MDCRALDDPEAVEMLVESRPPQDELGITDALLDCTDAIKGLSYSSVVTIGLWEAAGNNRGMAIKVFPDRESAVGWLMAAA